MIMAQGAFARAIRARRRELDLDQAALAARLDVSQQAVSRWERGLALPPPKRMAQVAAVLELDPAILMGYAGYLTPVEGSGRPERPQRASRRLTDMTDEQLLGMIERAWREFRSRRKTTLVDDGHVHRPRSVSPWDPSTYRTVNGERAKGDGS